jgi:hypothetical protein
LSPHLGEQGCQASQSIDPGGTEPQIEVDFANVDLAILPRMQLDPTTLGWGARPVLSRFRGLSLPYSTATQGEFQTSASAVTIDI